MSDAPSSTSLGGLIRAGVLDAELGGLLAVLVEGGLPVVVAGGPGVSRDEIARTLASLGGRDGSAALELAATDDPDPRSTARRFITAAAEGLPVAATMEADDLEGVFARLEAPPVRATRDELSHLGLVVVVGDDPTPDGGPHRVVAVHWVRPLTRDAHGHIQRLGPAVLATWEPRTGAWEHFAWGVIPELALRLGRRAGDLERDIAERADRLAVGRG